MILTYMLVAVALFSIDIEGYSATEATHSLRGLHALS